MPQHGLQSFTFSLVAVISSCFMVPGCGHGPLPRKPLDSTSGSVQINGDVWADNWFALYVGDDLLIEDSVPITTERSFNAESFSFRADYPIVLNFIAKDFRENDTGLEYIGSSRQQMGDGGLIAQFTDASTGKPIAVTNADWRCMVIHRGPLDESCEEESSPVAGQFPCDFQQLDEPEDWKQPDFDDTDWDQATVHSVSAVRPKDGYDRIIWDPKAKLIWGKDLKKDNTLLLRLVIEGP